MSKSIQWFIRRPKPEPAPSYEELVGLLARRTAERDDLRERIAQLEKDAGRYRFLFSDANLQAIKDACDNGKPLPQTHQELIEQIIGFYNTKQAADSLIDAAMEAK